MVVMEGLQTKGFRLQKGAGTKWSGKECDWLHKSPVSDILVTSLADAAQTASPIAKIRSSQKVGLERVCVMKKVGLLMNAIPRE